MNPLPLRITLTLGTRHHDVSFDELALALRDPDPHRALVKLLLVPDPQAMHKGKGTIGDGVLSLPVTSNVDKNSLPDVLNTVTVGNRGECRGEKGGSTVDKSEALAAYLADRLHDWRSFGFYRKVARMLPEPVVRDALTRALDVPSHAIRRSRAAYFTTIIVKSLGSTRRSPSRFDS